MGMTHRDYGKMLAILIARQPKDDDGWTLEHALMVAEKLRKLAPKTLNYATMLCNGGHEDYVSRLGARIDKQLSDVNEMLKQYGLVAFRTGDPRGHTLRLLALAGESDLPGNTWGGVTEGYAIKIV